MKKYFLVKDTQLKISEKCHPFWSGLNVSPENFRQPYNIMILQVHVWTP